MGWLLPGTTTRQIAVVTVTDTNVVSHAPTTF